MQKFARLLTIMFLALFAASSVVHAVSANSMALEMAVAVGDADVMPDCQGCDTDGVDNSNVGSCDLDCTTPGVATIDVATGPLFVERPSRHDRMLAVSLPLGRRGSPDPFPPNSLI
jgi:hypothetical protein